MDYKQACQEVKVLARELDVRHMTNYSGRRMFGSVCPALVAHASSLEGVDTGDLGVARMDSSGGCPVVYWPQYSVAESECPEGADYGY